MAFGSLWMVHSCLHSRGGEERKPFACFISRLLLQWAFSWPWTSRSPRLSHLSSFILSFAPAQRLQGVPCNLAHTAQYAALTKRDKDALIAIFLSLTISHVYVSRPYVSRVSSTDFQLPSWHMRNGFICHTHTSHCEASRRSSSWHFR